MTVRITIDKKDLEAAEQALKKMSKSTTRELRLATEKALVDVGDWLFTYPAKHSYLAGKLWWKTDRQRKWFFANLSAGNIRLKHRSGSLGKGWTSQARKNITSSGSNVTGVIGNTTPYARYVQDLRTQAPIHSQGGNWRTVQGVEKGAGKQIASRFETAMRNIIKTYRMASKK